MTDAMPLLQFIAIGACWVVVMAIVLRLALRDADAVDDPQ